MYGANHQTAKIASSASREPHWCRRIGQAGTALVPRAGLNRRGLLLQQPCRTEMAADQPRYLVPWLERQMPLPHPCSVRCLCPQGHPKALRQRRLGLRPQRARALVSRLQQAPQHHQPKPKRRPQRRGVTRGWRRQGRRRRCPVLSGQPARLRWTKYAAMQACLPDPCACSANARKHKTQKTRPASTKSAGPERMPSASTPYKRPLAASCGWSAIIFGSAAL